MRSNPSAVGSLFSFGAPTCGHRGCRGRRIPAPACAFLAPGCDEIGLFISPIPKLPLRTRFSEKRETRKRDQSRFTSDSTMGKSARRNRDWRLHRLPSHPSLRRRERVAGMRFGREVALRRPPPVPPRRTPQRIRGRAAVLREAGWVGITPDGSHRDPSSPRFLLRVRTCSGPDGRPGGWRPVQHQWDEGPRRTRRRTGNPLSICRYGRVDAGSLSARRLQEAK